MAGGLPFALAGYYLRGREANILLYEGVNRITRGMLKNSQYASRRQCHIYVGHDSQGRVRIKLIDTSRNGTYVNGVQIYRSSIYLDIDDIIIFTPDSTFKLKANGPRIMNRNSTPIV